jgi:hypothetical protein
VNEQDHDCIKRVLKETMQPISGQGGVKLRRDLWPAMLKRLEARPVRVPWFDWALLLAVAALLAFFPRAIPVLLYHL